MLNRLRRNQSGQTLVLFAGIAAMALVSVALVVDGTNAFVEKQHLQNTADAVALAASYDITLASSTCSGCATSASTYNTLNNGPSGSLPACSAMQNPPEPSCYQYPFIDSSGNPDYTKVLVQLHSCYPTIFVQVVGFSCFGISARSVASATALTNVTSTQSTSTSYSTSYGTSVSTTPGSGDEAFADSTACPAITYTGAGGGTIGALQTNGGVSIGGASGKTINYLSIGLENTCYTNSAATVGTVSGPFAPIAWPVTPPTVPTAPGGCTSLGSSSTSFTTSGHPAGIYCLTGTTSLLTISSKGTNLNGYTFFAPCITVSGGNFTNAAGTPPTLFDAYGTPTNCGASGSLQINGGPGDVVVNGGDLFAPNGLVAMSGGGISSGSGFIECQTLNISGTSAGYSGTGPTVGATTNTTTTSTNVSTNVATSTVTNTATTSTDLSLSQ